VQQAVTLKVPEYDKDVPAVVLVDDRMTTIGSDGRTTEVHNYAVRILRREGREYAVAEVGYLPDVGKVKEMRAWLIRPGSEPKRYGKDDAIDIAAALNDVYNEVRVRKISGTDDADAGAVFAYSYTVEDRSVFSQTDREFQDSLPVLSSRYSLTLPEGWRAETVTFNYPKIEPKVNGTSYTWELTNLPPVPLEPMSPSLTHLVPRLAVSYYPPATAQSLQIKTFSNWGEVAAWMAELEDPQVIVDDALSRKAYELTALAKTEMDKVRAIAQYVQNIQYISIQTGIGRGGGYRPRASNEVSRSRMATVKTKRTSCAPC
jgi:hypothetical protein